ncbi:hypothetical protein [Occallatibacter savannae]|uniref:hypothetical protein n=1 Tax=Occallatibacter savannae TaxID=1002691 RepID=UPI000D69A11E|nr:hypothetical protein [Occallatibacter savannae]
MTLASFTYKDVENLRKFAPRYFSFDVGELDEIVAGANIEMHRISVIDGTYLGDVLPKLDWWVAVGERASLAATEAPERVSASELAQFRSNFVGLVAGVLCRYSTALALNPAVAGFDSDGTDAALELLIHYSRLTCHVRAFAKRIWPEFDLGWLWAEA